MPYIPFGKLPGVILQRDSVSLNQLRGGVFSAPEFVLHQDSVIRSLKYNPTDETGWAIFGDGSASFYGDVYFGENAIFQGDLYSANWDGTLPLSLATRDTGATVGFGLDSSAGAVQFMGPVWLGGTLDVRGATTLLTTLTMGTGGLIRTASSGNRVEIGTTVATTAVIDLFDDYDADGGGLGKANGLTVFQAGATNAGQARPAITLYGPNAQVGVTNTIVLSHQAKGANGTVSLPGWSFDSDPDTGIYLEAANTMSLGAGGARGLSIVASKALMEWGSGAAPSVAFNADTDTGTFRVDANTYGIAAGGAEIARFSSAGIAMLTGYRAMIWNTGNSAGRILGKYDGALHDYLHITTNYNNDTGGIDHTALGTARVQLRPTNGGSGRIALGVGSPNNAPTDFVVIENTTGSGFYHGGPTTALGDVTVSRHVRNITAGTVTALGYHSSSVDHKEKIHPLVEEVDLTILDRLQPVAYDRKQEYAGDLKLRPKGMKMRGRNGFLHEWHFTIEDLQAIEPQLLTRDGSSVSHGAMLALLTAGLQEARREVAALKAEVAKLKV